jgi:RimJ/RimL family protein N-acetyltransferase
MLAGEGNELDPPQGEIEVELRDGSFALVRPVSPADKEAIRTAFARLSDETRYLRFLAPVQSLSESQLRYLTEVDHHDHEALVAYDREGRNGVGVARFVRKEDDPAAAEAAVVVDDEWQGRGLGTAMCRLLIERAREEGVARFESTLFADNRRMLHVIESLGPAEVVASAGATLTVVVEIPPEGMGEHIREVLRATAGGRAELAEAPGLRRAPEG